MSMIAARWIAFISACIAGLLALQVALALGLLAWNGQPHATTDLAMQSRQAAVAAIAAIVSVIAQIVGRAARQNKRD